MPTRLLLIRHAQSDWNAQHRLQGWKDRPLTDQGRQQATAAADHLKNESFQAVYSSPQIRSLETAQIVAQPHGLNITTDDRLKEISWGAFEGKTPKEVFAQHPEWEARIAHWAPGTRVPGGETRAEAAARITAAMYEIVARHLDETVLVVSHGGVLNTYIKVALGLSPEAQPGFRFYNASISEALAEPDGRFTLVYVNYYGHTVARNIHT